MSYPPELARRDRPPGILLATMSRKPPTRTFTIEQRPDGRFVSRNENQGDSPLGVDPSENMAIGTCRREATMASREGCTVIIKARQPGGKWKEVDRVEPPCA